MKVVVLGAGGLLGRHVVEEFGGREVVALARAACDVTDLDALLKHLAGADLVVNCAAFTNVDGAESDEDSAYRINALGAENAARAAAAAGARLVHVSTDFVFAGDQRDPYDEFDQPRPLSVYARSKWAGELLAVKACPRMFLVRVQGLYGKGGGNFASKLHELISAERPLRLDAERRVQPTSARAAARQIARLVETDAFGTYHVSCEGETTWAGFARLLAERLGARGQFAEVRTAELHAAAARPPNCLFHHRMLALRGLGRMPSWQAALDQYLAEMRI